MQQACGKNKLTFREAKLLINTFRWVFLCNNIEHISLAIDITYFRSFCPKYGEACG